MQAIHGDPLMRVSSDMPDDVLVLHDALQHIRDAFGTPAEYSSSCSQTLKPSNNLKQAPLVLHLKNCGTALRFLEVHLAKCYPGAPITLTGEPRLMERKGKPTTQTISALILHGEDIPVAENESPYIKMSREIKDVYEQKCSLPFREGVGLGLERDWSAAAFWYEYVAIHGGELLLEGLKPDSLQGDRIVADIYAEHLGVITTFTPQGALIRSVSPEGGLSVKRSVLCQAKPVTIDFVNIPDLYPAVALTCEKLSIELNATGTERLRYKESDRIEAVQKHEVRDDHRMAMALLAADFITLDSKNPSEAQTENDLQKIIAKSYPQFVEQWQSVSIHSRSHIVTITDVTDGSVTHITPRRGINDDNLGKKHALSKLIHAATTEYVWLHDDDVILPSVLQQSGPAAERSCSEAVLQKIGLTGNADLIILPLRMESSLPLGRGGVGSLLQIAEYAAIQELTMRTAKAGKAVMCSGANLIVRREAWLACEGDLHPEIPSGDDMFLLEAMKRRGMKETALDEPDYTAVVRPAPTWRAFLRQRMRWAGKASKYTDPDILRCGALVLAANLLQLLCPPVILVKFPIEYSLIKRREPQTSWLVALLLEILYPFYILLSLLGGLFRQREW